MGMSHRVAATAAAAAAASSDIPDRSLLKG